MKINTWTKMSNIITTIRVVILLFLLIFDILFVIKYFELFVTNINTLSLNHIFNYGPFYRISVFSILSSWFFGIIYMIFSVIHSSYLFKYEDEINSKIIDTLVVKKFDCYNNK